MAGLTSEIGKLVRTLSWLYSEEGQEQRARLLRSADLQFEETSYDNWNGGTYGYTLQLSVPASIYAAEGEGIDALEEELRKRLDRFTRLYPNESVEAVVITPSLEDEAQSHDLGLESEEPSFWKTNQLRAFFSHVSSIKPAAAALAESLGESYVAAFVAHEDIEPTKDWENEIRLALNTCEVLIPLLSPDFHASNWTDQEIGVAIGRGIPVIPIRLGVDPYGFIGRFQAFDGRSLKPEEIATRLVEILARHPRTCDRMAEFLVLSLEQSWSFGQAKERVGRLGLIQRWDEELIGRVQAALESNDQISNAFGVPAKVKQLLGQVGVKVDA